MLLAVFVGTKLPEMSLKKPRNTDNATGSLMILQYPTRSILCTGQYVNNQKTWTGNAPILRSSYKVLFDTCNEWEVHFNENTLVKEITITGENGYERFDKEYQCSNNQ